MLSFLKDFDGKYTLEEMKDEVHGMFEGVLDDSYPDMIDEAVVRVMDCFPDMSEDEAMKFVDNAI